MDDDFWEFINHVEEDFVPTPRIILRDNNNPFDKYTDIELIQRVRFSRHIIETIIFPMVFRNVPNFGNDNRGLPIPPAVKLYIALRFYATGSYQRVCGEILGISQSSVCRILNEVSEQLARSLPTFIRFPQNVNDFRIIKQDFFNIAGFPGVIGCVDGTHIEIKSAGGPNAELYSNRKGWMSLNVQVVAGPHCNIQDIVIRWPGSAPDSRIFTSSSVHMRLHNRSLPGILLGDSAYAETRHVYTPLLNPETRAEQRYNNAHIVTRNVVERTFGIWKGRFRCLTNALQLDLRNTTRIIAATAVLHNIAIRKRLQLPEQEYVRINHVPNLQPPVHMRGNAIRAAFIQAHFAN